MTLLGNAKNREIYSETGGDLLSSEEYQPPFLLEKDVASLQRCISQQSHLSRTPPIHRPSSVESMMSRLRVSVVLVDLLNQLWWLLFWKSSNPLPVFLDTEGKGDKLKTLKRIMYGRAGFAFLRQRLLHDA
jgi:hypothetical protein